MNYETLWQLAMDEARERVAKAREECVIEAFCADWSSSDQTADTTFSRAGTVTSAKYFPTLPSYLSNIIRQQTEGSAPSAQLLAGESGLLSSLMGQNRTQLPLPQVTEGIGNIDPLSYRGSGSLQAITDRNPYSNDWETGTAAMYDRILKQGLAQAQTGPENVRGGHARQGFAMADMNTQLGNQRFREVKQAQHQEAGDVMQAVQLANAIEASRRGTQLAGQQQAIAGQAQNTQDSLNAAGLVGRMRQYNTANVLLASDLLGRPTQQQTDNLRGQGSQVSNTTNWGTGVTCCFIFLEALNGALPWYVRRGRDDFNTPNRRAGYVAMSRWLVPLMRTSRQTRWLVNALMVKPFLRMGACHYGTSKRGVKWLALNIPCRFWFAVWSFTGWLGEKGKYATV